MNSILGMGFAPMGFSIFGYGSPATISQPVGNPLEPSINAASSDARFIDPYLRDYVIDSNGQMQGMSGIAQQVFLSIIMTLNSSAIPNFGSQLSRVKTIDQSTIQTKVTSYVQSALSSMIQKNLIKLINVSVSVNTNGIALNLIINWQDMTTVTTQQTIIALS